MSSYCNPHIDPDELNSIKADTPSRAFDQEYMAEFVESLTAGMFRREWFQLSDRPPKDYVKLVRAWDLAASSSPNSDFTVGVLMGVTESGYFYVLDVVRGKWRITERDEMILSTAKRDGSGVSIVIEEEGGSGGKAQSKALSRMLAGYRVKTVRPTGDKPTRAAPFASQVGAGNVFIVQNNIWLREYLNELEGFPDPNASHDDQVDATAYAFNELSNVDPTAYAYGTVIGGKRNK
jgi:predicted phage terminase large subunit-like protein